MEMAKKTWGEIYRNTVICVDSYDEGIMKGRFFNPYLENGEEFSSLPQFLLKMEEIMNEMDFPQKTVSPRSFLNHLSDSSLKRYGSVPDDRKQKGKAGTFYMRILFRQNASWQGTLTWSESQERASFRSVLELVCLLDSALGRD